MAATKGDTILNVGELFAERYRVVRELGQGGFGAVYEAEDLRLKRRAAVKVLHPSVAKDKKTKARFKREALAAARIDHPSVVQVLEQGETADGTLFIVMEYVDGVTLLSELKAAHTRGMRLGPAKARAIGWQTARVLARTHERGIYHRDLKPANLMLVDDDAVVGGVRIKILDFGIAKLRPGAAGTESGVPDDDDVIATSMGDQQPGTFAYMAPEQFGTYQGYTGHEGQMDVYALGVMMYQMLAGRLPLYSPDPLVMMGLAQAREPERLTAIDTTLPVELADLVHRMLAKEIQARPTMAQVCDALAAQLGVGRSNDSVHIRGLAEGTGALAGKASSQELPDTASANEAAMAATADAPAVGGTAGAGTASQAGGLSAAPSVEVSVKPLSVSDRSTQPQSGDEAQAIEPPTGGGQQITNPASKAQRRAGRKRLLYVGAAAAVLGLATLVAGVGRWGGQTRTPMTTTGTASTPMPTTPSMANTPVPTGALGTAPATGSPTPTPVPPEAAHPTDRPATPTAKVEGDPQAAATAHKHKAVACRVPKDSCISTGIKSATDRQAILAALREAEVHLCGSDRLTFDLRAGKPNLILVPPRLGPAERDALRAALLGRFHTSGLSASVSVQCK